MGSLLTISPRNNLNSFTLVRNAPFVFKAAANQKYAVFAGFGCQACNVDKGWVHLAVFSPQHIALNKEPNLARDFANSEQPKVIVAGGQSTSFPVAAGVSHAT